jgi:elongation factor Ts
LREDNTTLRTQNLILTTQLQKLNFIEAENIHLRNLLESSKRIGERILIAELLSVDMDPYKQQVTINKGSAANDDIYSGQPFVDAKGIMGKLVHIGPFSSTALLITDPGHALPIQVNRNGLRAIAKGTGSQTRLDIPHLPNNADIKVGDLLVTSGLGCVFPVGYPAAVVVEINSETDFVAKDENFVAFADAVAATALANGTEDVAALATQSIGDGKSVEQARTDLVAKVGENISVRRAAIVENTGSIGFYTHGARIGAIVTLEGGDDDLARDIAMHVAATNPLCIDETGVPAETLERERRIFTEQAAESGKPPEIVEKMVTGRVAKFLKEITLVGQPFVKDPDQTVAKLLGAAGASVKSFVRFEVGEGIEKKEENFADEVMKQIEDAKKDD